MINFKDKKILITGATGGIGKALVKKFLSLDGNVLATGTKIEKLDALKKEFPKINVLKFDISDHSKIEEFIENVSSQLTGLDILVNNAAANPYFGHVLDTDLGAYNKTVEVNIRGYFFMSIEAGKLMRENGGGSIVNTASVNGMHPGPGQGIYSISKAAVINMTKTFARECAPFNIRCNALLPGLTKTKFAGALFNHDEFYQEAIKSIPMSRHAEPKEMAGTVLYLASNASSYTTGECIVVDGGMYA